MNETPKDDAIDACADPFELLDLVSDRVLAIGEDEPEDPIEVFLATREVQKFRKEYNDDSGYIQDEHVNEFILRMTNNLEKEETNTIIMPRASSKNKCCEGFKLRLFRILGLKITLFKIMRWPFTSIKSCIRKEVINAVCPHHIVKEVTLNGEIGAGMDNFQRKFENWGRTVKTRQNIRTFFPKTKLGLCNLVKWAKASSLGVRVSGYRHSWSDITVNDGQVLVSMLPPGYALTLPAKEPKIDVKNELQKIELLDKYVEENGVRKRLCKIGASVTNEQLREWVIKNSKRNRSDGEQWGEWWTIPFNVILVEITYGGSNGPICHGAGRKSTTLSDLVAAIEFVNANGEIQVVDDPMQLKSASGCFGMLGIVTSITMKLDPLTFARCIPKKKHVALTIPPPKGFDVPANIDMSGITDAMLEEAFEDFKDKCDNAYYSEWFWYPGQKKCWINCWDNDGDQSKAVMSPDPLVKQYQEASTFLSAIANNTLFELLPPKFQIATLSTFAMFEAPERDDDHPSTTPLIEALHFRRGIHNIPCVDMEWEIPIPSLPSDPSKPDYSVCQKAWWAAIKLYYERFNAAGEKKKDKDWYTPMRLPLEMRITGGSSVNLAPQFGNNHGTCSIEVLTPKNVDRKAWTSYMQDITDLWLNLKDDDGNNIHPIKKDDGQLLYCRPHWAKEWQGLKVNGVNIEKYMIDKALKEQIPLYVKGLEAVAESGGYELKDATKLFSTKFSRNMFGLHDLSRK